MKPQQKLMETTEENVELNSEQQVEWFTGEFPNSALGCHRRGRRATTEQEGNRLLNLLDSIDKILEHSRTNNIVMNWLYRQCSPNMSFPQCCREIYNKIVDINQKTVCFESLTDKKLWDFERKFRVTGSRCYRLYTFKKSDWDIKAMDYFCGQNFTNCYIRHGIKYEPVALNTHEKQLGPNEKIIQVGLIICRQHPWMAYSPDGILFIDGKPQQLIEVKCPYACNESTT